MKSNLFSCKKIFGLFLLCAAISSQVLSAPKNVKYDDILNDLQDDLDGYEHRTLIYYGMGHNFTDWDKKPVAVMSDPQAWRDEGNRKTKK